MHRRDFARTLAGTVLGAAVLPSAAAFPKNESSTIAEAPFRLSVMLWTVHRDLPFEQRLEKVAEAGYHAVELVGEFDDWSEADFKKYNTRKRSLGITFDATAGVKDAANPAAREAFLANLTKLLNTADKLECPAIIVLSGDRVEGLSHDVQHQSCVETLKRAADIAARKNVTLLLENIDP